MVEPFGNEGGFGTIFAVMVWFLIFYSIWSIGLLIEIYTLHKQGQTTKRNCNLVMVLILPILQFFRLLFLEVILL